MPLVFLLYQLKKSENHWFSDVFRGIEREQCTKWVNRDTTLLLSAKNNLRGKWNNKAPFLQ